MGRGGCIKIGRERRGDQDKSEGKRRHAMIWLEKNQKDVGGVIW